MRVFLCEKPSQGKDIARVLGAGQRGNGCYSGGGYVVSQLDLVGLWLCVYSLKN